MKSCKNGSERQRKQLITDDKLLELREKLAKCQEAFRLESKLGDLLKRQNDKKALFERLKLEVQRLDSESKVEFPASIVQFRTS